MAKDYNWKYAAQEDVTETFSASFGDRKIDLSATYKKINGFTDLDLAMKFFGGQDELIAAAIDSVNRQQEILAKSAARNFEVRVNRLADDNIATLIEKRGPLTDEQMEKVRTKAREHLIRLDEITRAGIVTDDI